MNMASIMAELEDSLRDVANEYGGTVDVVRAEAAEVLPFKPLPPPDGSDCIIEGEFSETEPIPEDDFPEDIVFSDGTVLDDV